MSGEIDGVRTWLQANGWEWAHESTERNLTSTIATLTADLAAERAEVARLKADPTIYKHQCGHCRRLSPLPFLIPGYLMGGPS